MSRAKKIESEAAVQAAMVAFWKHGYGNLGTRQLEEETGITRFTLQTSYGGKLPLFLTALDNYIDLFEIHAAPNVNGGGLEGIARWFEDRAEPKLFADIACYGCLMLNSTVEFASQDAGVNQRAGRFFMIVRGGFQAALNSAKNDEVISSDFDVESMAEVLMGAALGLNIIIRSAADNASGKDMASSIAKLVRGWEVD